jgi:hypothetical protein
MKPDYSILPSDTTKEDSGFLRQLGKNHKKANRVLARFVNKRIRRMKIGAEGKDRLRKMTFLGLSVLGAEDRRDPTHVRVTQGSIDKAVNHPELSDSYLIGMLRRALSAVMEYNCYLNSRYETAIESSWLLKEIKIFFTAYLWEIKRAGIRTSSCF